MGLILVTGDFTGKYKISQNSFSELDSYITTYEKKYLVDLLGADLYILFAADIDGTTRRPITQKFIDIFDPISEDDRSSLRVSDGIKIMLLGFIWFEYLRDQAKKNTVSGSVTNQTESGQSVSYDQLPIYSRYNNSIFNLETIQWFIRRHIEDYPEFNGQKICLSHWCL